MFSSMNVPNRTMHPYCSSTAIQNEQQTKTNSNSQINLWIEAPWRNFRRSLGLSEYSFDIFTIIFSLKQVETAALVYLGDSAQVATKQEHNLNEKRITPSPALEPYRALPKRNFFFLFLCGLCIQTYDPLTADCLLGIGIVSVRVRT